MTAKTQPRIVTTQRADLAAPLVSLLQKRGARVLQVPVTRWTPPPNPARLDTMLAKARAKPLDWILLSNQHAAHHFLDRCAALFGARDVRALAGTRLGAYGPVTGRALRDLGIKPDAVAADHKTHLILAALGAATKTGAAKIKGLRFLIIRGDPRQATQKVPQALRKLGARVDTVQGYALATDTRDLTGDAADMLKHGADWLVFATARAMRDFDSRFGAKKFLRRFPRARLAVTNKTLCAPLKKTTGAAPSVIARPNDARDLVEKIEKFSEAARATARATTRATAHATARATTRATTRATARSSAHPTARASAHATPRTSARATARKPPRQ